MTLGNWLALSELVLTAAGFSLAIWQLWRAASAAERTEARLKVNELLFALPQLHRLEQDLDDAARAVDIDRSIRALNDWRRQASTVAAFLHSEDGATELIVELRKSVELAGGAKNALVEGKTNPLTVTRDVRSSVERVCRDLPRVAAELRSKIGGNESDGNP